MRILSLFLLFLILYISYSVADPMISEVYPDTWVKGDEDEFVTINMSSEPGLISLSDGEGTITIIQEGNKAGKIIIARNGEAFRRVWGHYPDYEIVNSTLSVPEPAIKGKFQLANKNDELSLTQDGRLIQNISWPGDFQPKQGQIHFSYQDRKWDRRVLMAGGSNHVPDVFSHISGVVFVSPDCSRKILEDLLSEAQNEVLLNVYEFTDPGFAELICDAISRGVKVTVLLEGGPVGGVPADEYPVIKNLTDSGARVLMMSGSDEEHAPYRYDHAKYIISDKKKVLLTTENFKLHSFPPSGYSGNRGWGILLDSPELATYFSDVFKEDINGPGIYNASGRFGEVEDPSEELYRPTFSATTFSDAEVTPVLSPDTSYLISDMINESRDRVWIEQAYITEYPDGKKNPFLGAAVNAARRGVDVRIILDGYYYNIEGDKDNDEMVISLQTLASRENITLKAKILYPEKNNLLKLHTKGVIADNRVLVSSMNWNENSACFNREAGVIVNSKTVASYFASVFLQDWSGSELDKTPAAYGASNKDGIIQVIQVLALGGVMVFLILLYRRYHR